MTTAINVIIIIPARTRVRDAIISRSPGIGRDTGCVFLNAGRQRISTTAAGSRHRATSHSVNVDTLGTRCDPGRVRSSQTVIIVRYFSGRFPCYVSAAPLIAVTAGHSGGLSTTGQCIGIVRGTRLVPCGFRVPARVSVAGSASSKGLEKGRSA